MRTIIAGGRDITDYGLLLKAIAACPWKISFVINGGAKGADALGLRWAKENSIVALTYNANWTGIDRPGAVVRRRRDGVLYDAAAGHARNALMAQDAEALLALWDGQSRGTANMIDEAHKRGLKVCIFRVDQVTEPEVDLMDLI